LISRQREQKARAERLKEGIWILGQKGALAPHRDDRPGSREPHRNKMSPRPACRSKWARIEALRRNKTSNDAYANARERWLPGDRSVAFPCGVR
jgi:hypothetical protein